jgi:hypothetical protein
MLQAIMMGGAEQGVNLTQTSHRWIIQGAGPATVIDASELQDRVFQIVNPVPSAVACRLGKRLSHFWPTVDEEGEGHIR